MFRSELGWASAAFELLFLIVFPTRSAMAQQSAWELSIGSWNVLNLSEKKVTYSTKPVLERDQLIQVIVDLAGKYDIIVFQEVLQDGDSIIRYVQPKLQNYTCNYMSVAAGYGGGRRERYVFCNVSRNQWGTISISPPFDDYSSKIPNIFRAADGSLQTAQDVWMRPPAGIDVLFTPSQPGFNPFKLQIYTIHTKPEYGRNFRPPGVPKNALGSDSVHYELRAIEENLPRPSSSARLLIGDLNADCASYPGRWRYKDFPTWNWYPDYGVSTTTAPSSLCAYDRTVIESQLEKFRISSDRSVDRDPRVPTIVDGKTVSDHYPVFIKFGEPDNRGMKRARASIYASATASQGVSSPDTTAPPAKKSRYTPQNSVHVKASGLPTTTHNAQLYIVAYDKARNYKSNLIYSLTDVRGAPTPVTINERGEFDDGVIWSNPVPGAYVFVLDLNGDGQFVRADRDFANFATQADIFVAKDEPSHNRIVTLDDDLSPRSTFDLSRAWNVYLAARDLPKNASGRIYILSNKILRREGYNPATFRADLKNSNTIVPFFKFAIPINASTARSIDSQQVQFLNELISQPFTASPDGDLFTSIWSVPKQLAHATVDYQPPPADAFSDDYVGLGDDYDPCASVDASSDENLRRVCNVGFGFADHYGNSFTVVLDIDNDGMLGPSDPDLTVDLGHMKDFFDQNPQTSLSPRFNGNPAISEYKEYLSRALGVKLSADNIFDGATIEATRRLTCSSDLSRSAFDEVIVPDHQDQFTLLGNAAYRNYKSGNRFQRFGYATFAGMETTENESCLSGESLSFSDKVQITHGISAVASWITFDNATVNNDKGSMSCWEAAERITLGPNTRLTTSNDSVISVFVGPPIDPRLCPEFQ